MAALIATSTPPKTLPIVPMVDRVLLPGVVMHLRTNSTVAAKLIEERVMPFKNLAKTPVYIGCVPLLGGSIPDAVESNSMKSLNPVGCLARVVRVRRMPGQSQAFLALIVGIARFRVIRIVRESPYVEAEIENYSEQQVDKENVELSTLISELRTCGRDLLEILQEMRLSPIILQQFKQLIETSTPGALADLLMAILDIDWEDKLAILNAIELTSRISKAVDLLKRHNQILRVAQRINGAVEDNMSEREREAILRQQLKSIRSELAGEGGSGNLNFLDDENELDELERRLGAALLPEEADKIAQRELRRLRRMHPAQAEYAILRAYLEWICELPWSVSSPEERYVNLADARRILDQDHFGLEPIKRRLIEYLAVTQLQRQNAENFAENTSSPASSSNTSTVPGFSPKRLTRNPQSTIFRAPILCLLGPPGVGKTSLGRSVARVLGRRLHRIALGGIRDEAEIRGHRRTYVGALPGLIIQAMRQVGVSNPVILLDEVDKLGRDSFRGDPAAALLEVLDPEQNHTFHDHYLNIPFDLSRVLFITTANETDTISPALLDRMEVIRLPGYTFEEKVQIASQHLLPKQLRAHGLTSNDLRMSNDILMRIATGYTREAGVRNLEREIAAVCRSTAVEIAEEKYGHDGSETSISKVRSLSVRDPDVTAQKLENILGVVKYELEVAERKPTPGVVTGLAWTPLGTGGLLFIEASRMMGTGKLILTGHLGEVMRESAQTALSWVRSHSKELKLVHLNARLHLGSTSVLKDTDIHLHFPSGATPKDGPSAGIAIVCALVSLLAERTVDPRTAMSGEITLRGAILPVGGVKEKLLAAHRGGIRRVLLPHRNSKDLSEIASDVLSQLTIVFVRDIKEALREAFQEDFEFVEVPVSHL